MDKALVGRQLIVSGLVADVVSVDNRRRKRGAVCIVFRESNATEYGTLQPCGSWQQVREDEGGPPPPPRPASLQPDEGSSEEEEGGAPGPADRPPAPAGAAGLARGPPGSSPDFEASAARFKAAAASRLAAKHPSQLLPPPAGQVSSHRGAKAGAGGGGGGSAPDSSSATLFVSVPSAAGVAFLSSQRGIAALRGLTASTPGATLIVFDPPPPPGTTTGRPQRVVRVVGASMASASAARDAVTSLLGREAAAAAAAHGAPTPGALTSAASMPSCVAALLPSPPPPAGNGAVPHADAFRAGASAAATQLQQPQQPQPPQHPPAQPSPPPFPAPLSTQPSGGGGCGGMEDATHDALASFIRALDRMNGAADAIAATSRIALSFAHLPGFPRAAVAAVARKAEHAPAGARERVHALFLSDSIAQNAAAAACRHAQPGSPRGAAASALVAAVVNALPRLLRAVAPEARAHGSKKQLSVSACRCFEHALLTCHAPRRATPGGAGAPTR